jgi:hypothetical protein
VLSNLGATLERWAASECRGDVRDARALTASGYGEGVVNASLGLGRVCDRTARAVEARMHLETALDVAQHAQLRGYEVEAHDALADLHERSGNSTEAVHHLRGSREIERTLLSEASDRRLKMLSVRYQVTAAQRETDLLRAKQEELAKANARLAALNLSSRHRTRRSRAYRLARAANARGEPDRPCEPAPPRPAPARQSDRARYGRPLAVAIADLDHSRTSTTGGPTPLVTRC